jgi:hypothetical protein
MSFVNDKSELLKCDTSAVGDKFGWLEEIRGLDLQMLDLEERFEGLKENLETMTKVLSVVEEKGRRQRKVVDEMVGTSALMADVNHSHELTKLKQLKIQYKSIKEICDSIQVDLNDTERKLNAFEHKQTDDPDDIPEVPTNEYNKMHWNNVWSTWEEIYSFLLFKGNKMSLSYSAFLYDLAEDKLKRREITMYHYVRVASVLAMRLGWSDEVNRIAKMKLNFKTQPAKPTMPEPRLVSYEDRYFGEMSYNENDLINAIDTRAAAERCGCNVYDFQND